jgi:virginiamycin B lyase
LSTGELAAEETATVREHLFGCAWCRAQVATYDILDAAIQRHLGADSPDLEAPYHPLSLERVMRLARQTSGMPASRTTHATRQALRPPQMLRFLSGAGALAAVLLIAVLAQLTLGSHTRPPKGGTPPLVTCTALTGGHRLCEHPLPTPDSQPADIAIAPDGSVWFTEQQTNRIGQLTSDGTLREYPIPTAASDPFAITLGPGGDFWFTERSTNKIGRITPQGTITEFTVPTVASAPTDIVLAPPQDLWFTESGASQIGRITPQGTITEFSLPAGAGAPTDIVLGPDDAVWFLLITSSESKIGRLTRDGAFSAFTIGPSGLETAGLAAGPDGALWFAESRGNAIGRMTIGGAMTIYPLPEAHSLPLTIASAAGNLWFLEQAGNRIGMITVSGAITEYAVPLGKSGLLGIATAADGSVWFTQLSANAIGQLT